MLGSRQKILQEEESSYEFETYLVDGHSHKQIIDILNKKINNTYCIGDLAMPLQFLGKEPRDSLGIIIILKYHYNTNKITI